MDQNNQLNQPPLPEDEIAPLTEESVNTVDLSEKEDMTRNISDNESAEKIISDKEPKSDNIVPPPQNIPYTPPAYTYKWEYSAQQANDIKHMKKEKQNGLLTYALILSVAFLLSMALLIGVLIIDTSDRTFSPTTGVSSDEPLSELYAFCHPSYVAISTISDKGGEGAGSGIVMTKSGYICTNYHVVDGVKTIKVILSDERTYTAEFIDGDALNDIAVIKIQAPNLTPAVIGTSKDSAVGDRVMAIGTPYGIEYRGTMTSGYISALDRQYALRNESGTVNKVQTLIQTDTSVNPGNSGGPLFNMKGEVIGVVSMKIADTDYEGMGFAIPIESVIDMIHDIIKNGKITDSAGGAREGAALGISGFSVQKDQMYLLHESSIYYVVPDPETGAPSIRTNSIFEVYIPIDDEAQLKENGFVDYEIYTAPVTGVRIDSTTEGFHSNEVLQARDVVVSANGITIDTMSTLQSIVANCNVGDKLNLEVYRGGDIIAVTVTLGSSSTME